MTKKIIQQAEMLESLLPCAIRAISPPADQDPLGHLPLGQLRVLRALAEGPRSASEVAGELRLSLSALSQLIQRLLDAKLVEKRGHPHDRRIKILSLTSTGEILMRKRHEIRVCLAQKLLSQVSPEMRDSLLVSLEQLIAQAPNSESGTATIQTRKDSNL